MESVLSESFKQSAHEELNRLRKQRDEVVADIDAKIQGLERLLSPQAFPVAPGAVASPFSVMVKLNTQDERPLGLAAAIERVLAAHPTGLRPYQVSDKLRSSGFQVPGKIKLQDRVAGEMARLKRTNKLDRDSEGIYRINPLS